MPIRFNYLGDPPIGFAVLSAVSTYLNLRVTFSEAVKLDSELLDPSNYQITVDLPDQAFDFYAVSVTPEAGVTEPTYVDLEVTDCTNGEDYTLVITPGQISNAADTATIDAGANEADFVGVSEAPIVLSAFPLSTTTIRVTYSKIMAANADLTLASRYTFTGGLQCLKVERETDQTVILTTSEQSPGTIYELTVS